MSNFTKILGVFVVVITFEVVIGITLEGVVVVIVITGVNFPDNHNPKTTTNPTTNHTTNDNPTINNGIV